MDYVLEWLGSLIISVIDYTGYVGVFFLMLVESANIPVPSEITMPFAGYLTSTGRLNFYWVVLLGALGNLVGSLVAYYIGYFGGRSFVKKYGNLFFIHQQDVELAERMFVKYGKSIVFFSRLLPVVRTFISTPAGIAKMNIWQFSIYTFVGSLIWSALLTYTGFVAGKNWGLLEPYFRKFNWVIIGLGIVIGVWWIFRYYKKVKNHG